MKDNFYSNIKEITIKMGETQDAFICETIIPFVESRTNWKVSKDELIKALEKQIPKKPTEYFRCPSCKRDNIYFDYCEFFENITFDYCPDCGQRIEWDEEEE